jgi:hypothetical protein
MRAQYAGCLTAFAVETLPGERIIWMRRKANIGLGKRVICYEPGAFFRSEFSRRERNFLLQRLMGKIGCGDALTIGRDGIAPRTTSNIPAKRRFFRAGTVQVVWKDWMVVQAVTYEPVSAADLATLRELTGQICEFGRFQAAPCSCYAVFLGLSGENSREISTGIFLNGHGKMPLLCGNKNRHSADCVNWTKLESSQMVNSATRL